MIFGGRKQWLQKLAKVRASIITKSLENLDIAPVLYTHKTLIK
jgi:hypothetical protein